jgi:ribonuclease R
VIEARNYGLLVELPEAMMTGLVPVSSMEDDFYHFDAPRSRLVGKNSKKVLKAGDILRVQVARVDPFKQQIDFRVAREPRPAKGGTHRPQGGKADFMEGLTW